jgi:cyclin B
VPDVVGNLFKEELCFVPRAGFMDAQVDINCKMRAILVDWLVEVHQKYNLRSVTLFLTVNIIDRYLALAPVPRKRLQLVGVVALSIAAKFEEIQPPRLADYAYITDNAYTKNDVINMECVMLAMLDFRIVAPTVAHFLECFQCANRCDNMHQKVSWYLAELAFMDPRLTSKPPSLLAAASVLLSNELVGRSPRWPAGLVRHTRRTEIEVQSCAAELRSALAGAPANSLQAIRRKYTSQADHAVAKIVEPN